MTTITVPINDELNNFIHSMIEDHKAETKAGVVRMALQKLKEEELFREITLASEAAKRGEYYEGDLDELIEKISDD